MTANIRLVDIMVDFRNSAHFVGLNKLIVHICLDTKITRYKISFIKFLYPLSMNQVFICLELSGEKVIIIIIIIIIILKFI